MIEESEIHRAVREEFGVDLRVLSFWRIRERLAEAQREATPQTPVVCLVPARTDTKWWWDYAPTCLVRFLKTRVRFSGRQFGASFPSAVLVFGNPPSTKTEDVFPDVWPLGHLPARPRHTRAD